VSGADLSWMRVTVEGGGKPSLERVRRFRLEVVEGQSAGLSWESSGSQCQIGAHPSNDLVLADSTVSRFHCEVRVEPDGPWVRDLGSRNGTQLDGVAVREGLLREGSLLRVGGALVRLSLRPDEATLALSEHGQFGSLLGSSVVMRAAFARLEKVAGAAATVLLEGETGTGKGAAAEAIHQQSPRREQPFVVVDCSALSPALLESELFGHEKGAFTSAEARRIGAFEEASGGTLFLDEIGELSADLQPKLLRVLEGRTIRRVGSNKQIPVDVRVIAATNRDLRAEVNAGRFRPDLYFRLAVLRITLPALRQRLDDVPAIARGLLGALGASREQIAAICSPERLERLTHAAWPGNVRELRNVLERALVFDEADPEADAPGGAAAGAGAGSDGALTAAPGLAAIDARIPFADARRRALDAFERGYVQELLRLHQGHTVQAAQSAGINRVYLYRLARKHGVKPT